MKVYITLWDIMKSIIVIGIVALLFFKGDLYWDKVASAMGNKNSTQITRPVLERITENAVRLSNKANDKRFSELEKKLDRSNSIALKIAKEYANKTGSNLKTLGQIVADMKSSFNTQKPDKYIDKEKISRSYDDVDIVRTMPNGEQLPMGWVKYHPALNDEDPFTVFNYPLEYYTTIVKTENEDGLFSYSVDAYVENNYVKKVRGKKFPLHIKNVTFEEKLIKDKKFRFNPRIALGGAFNDKNIFPMLNVSLWSYGRTKRDMDWRFGIFGAGAYSSNGSTYGALSASPFEYNLGNHIPYIENLFIGPTFNFTTGGDTAFGFEISIPF